MPRRIRLSRRHLLASAIVGATTIAAPGILRAQGPGGRAPLKVGVLLPRSGFEASIGQDCQRGVDIAPGILKSLNLPELAVMNADTESNVDVARERAEKLINDGAQLLIGIQEFPHRSNDPLRRFRQPVGTVRYHRERAQDCCFHAR
jgi:branched-chain amino acid transport system substrate-binding protein